VVRLREAISKFDHHKLMKRKQKERKKERKKGEKDFCSFQNT
jgi:hypothetical protein